MSPYSAYGRIQTLSPPERVKEFKETALQMLEMGISTDDLKKLIPLYEEDEMYEAAQAVKEAIEEHSKPKLLLSIPLLFGGIDMRKFSGTVIIPYTI